MPHNKKITGNVQLRDNTSLYKTMRGRKRREYFERESVREKRHYYLTVWKEFGISLLMYLELTDKYGCLTWMTVIPSYKSSMSFSVVKNMPVNAGGPRDVGLIPGSGRSPGTGKGKYCNILAWKIPWTEEPTVHRVTKSQMQQRACTHTHTHARTHIHTHTHTPPNLYSCILQSSCNMATTESS